LRKPSPHLVFQVLEKSYSHPTLPIQAFSIHVSLHFTSLQRNDWRKRCTIKARIKILKSGSKVYEVLAPAFTLLIACSMDCISTKYLISSSFLMASASSINLVQHEVIRCTQSAPWIPRTRWFTLTLSGRSPFVDLRIKARPNPF